MCSATTCPIKSTMFYLKRRDYLPGFLFRGVPCCEGFVLEGPGGVPPGRCFLCIYGAVNGTGLLPHPPTGQSPRGLPPGVIRVLHSATDRAEPDQRGTKRNKNVVRMYQGDKWESPLPSRASAIPTFTIPASAPALLSLTYQGIPAFRARHCVDRECEEVPGRETGT